MSNEEIEQAETRKRTSELFDIVTTFKNVPVTPKVLQEFCKRKGYDPISTGQFEDLMYQIEHDNRVMKAMEEIKAIMGQIKYTPYLISDADRAEIAKHNESLEYKIVEAVQNAGVLIDDYNILYDNVQKVFGVMIGNCKIRTENMATKTYRRMAVNLLGKDYTVKNLSDYLNAEQQKDIRENEKKTVDEPVEAEPVNEEESVGVEKPEEEIVGVQEPAEETKE